MSELTVVLAIVGGLDGCGGQAPEERRGGREQGKIYLCVTCGKVSAGVQLFEDLRSLAICRMAVIGPWPGLTICTLTALMHLLEEKAFPDLHST